MDTKSGMDVRTCMVTGANLGQLVAELRTLLKGKTVLAQNFSRQDFLKLTIKGIGRELHDQWGFVGMQDTFEYVPARQQHWLEHLWNGIGSWQA